MQMKCKWLFLVSLILPAAQATQLELIYNGVFNTQNALNPASQSTPTYFSAPTPFTINAWFDTASTNYAPPSPPAPPPFAGFRAFAPTVATIQIGGTLYSIDTFTTNPTAGLTVAVFDRNTFTPGKYGIGILQQPPQDGAGIVADFDGASPDFTGSNIVATTFTGYNGVGYSSGVCLQGTGGNCQLAEVTPFVLRAGGSTYSLTLGNFLEEYSAPPAPGSGGIAGPLNSVQLVAVPEPSTYALVGISALLLMFQRVTAAKRQSSGDSDSSFCRASASATWMV